MRMRKMNTRKRKHYWVDAQTLDESEFKDNLIKYKGKWEKLLPIQGRYGKIIYQKAGVTTIMLEDNEDGTPRDVILIPTCLLKLG